MTWIDRLGLFSTLDAAAVALLLVCWIGIGWRIEHPGRGRASVTVLMEGYRREWMTQMITRQPRVFDSQLLGNLRQGIAFFASASMIAIGGGIALVGDTERLAGLAADLTLEDAPAVVWEIKLLLLLLFLANAFLKFVWAHRLFGYCAVIMASVPNEPEAPLAAPRATKAAEINITAARSFNRGMRATYFGLSSAAWLLGAIPLICTVLVITAVLWRREFASRSRQILLQTPAATQT